MAKIFSSPTSEWLCPGYPPLKGEVGQAAIKDKVLLYPQVARSMIDDPVMNQSVGIISFMMAREPVKLKNGKYFLGFFKLRGNYHDLQKCEEQAEKIILEQDSKWKNRIGQVGHWLPIVDDDGVCKTMLDVDTNIKSDTDQDTTVHLRDRVARDNQTQQQKIMRELREREEELKSGDIYDDPEALKYYTMKRVTDLRLGEAVEIKLKEIEDMKLKIINVRRELKSLEKRHPTYPQDWIDCYNVERRKSGIKDYVPSEKQEQDYRNWSE